jgi:hypothetical protein
VFHISTYLRGMESIGWLSEDWFSATSPFDWERGAAPMACPVGSVVAFGGLAGVDGCAGSCATTKHCQSIVNARTAGASFTNFTFEDLLKPIENILISLFHAAVAYSWQKSPLTAF